MGYLVDQLVTDVRFREGLHACMSCGTCTAICPAAGFSDYDPRILVETVQRKDETTLEELLSTDFIWRCGECLSCKTRCPRGNTPGYLIQALRLLSLKTGLYLRSEQGRLQDRLRRNLGSNMLNYGYCLHIDVITGEEHPEQGPVWDWYRNNREAVLQRLGANYGKEGAGTLRKISSQALADLQAIFYETGALRLFDRMEQAMPLTGDQKTNISEVLPNEEEPDLGGLSERDSR